MNKNDFFRKIEANIDEHGYHVTIVTGGACPRFAYTIGLKDKIGYELIFAGSENLPIESVTQVISEIRERLTADNKPDNVHISLALGNFDIAEVDSSWSRLLLLGVFDFYQINHIKAFQIVPDQQVRTLDVPDLSIKFDVSIEPIWKWLIIDWPYPVPYDSTAITNASSLYGQKVTEATRWEENEWEIFVGSGLDIDKENTCIVPLATLLGIDSSLAPVLNLSIGKGIWRDADELIWHDWN